MCVFGRGRGGREFEDYREDQDTEINKRSEFKDVDETVYETSMHLANVAPKAGSLDIWGVEAQERCYGGGVAVPSNTPRLTLHVGEHTTFTQPNTSDAALQGKMKGVYTCC